MKKAEDKPLLGKRIVVTRASKQAGELSQQLHALGADVLELPTIKILPPVDPGILREAIEGIGEYDWIIFASPNAVEFFFEEFFKQYPDIRSLGILHVAAMGPGTAKQIEALHLEVELQPKESDAESMIKAFKDSVSIPNLRILLPRADIARDVLSRKLEELGAIVDDIEAYRNVIEEDDIGGVVRQLMTEGADVVTFASPSAVQGFCKKVDVAKLRAQFPSLSFASIGPITTEAAKKLGLPIGIEPIEHSLPALVKEIQKKLAP